MRRARTATLAVGCGSSKTTSATSSSSSAASATSAVAAASTAAPASSSVASTPTTTAAAATSGVVTTAPAPAATAGDTTPAIVAATNAFLATLTDAERKAVSFEFSNTAQRQKWSNLPEGIYQRSGLMWGDMSDASKTAWLTIMQTLGTGRRLRAAACTSG